MNRFRKKPPTESEKKGPGDNRFYSSVSLRFPENTEKEDWAATGITVIKKNVFKSKI